jgi:hypothetical protein
VVNNRRGKVLFAPIDVYLGETETYQPDIIFIAATRVLPGFTVRLESIFEG